MVGRAVPARRKKTNTSARWDNAPYRSSFRFPSHLPAAPKLGKGGWLKNASLRRFLICVNLSSSVVKNSGSTLSPLSACSACSAGHSGVASFSLFASVQIQDSANLSRFCRDSRNPRKGPCSFVQSAFPTAKVSIHCVLGPSESALISAIRVKSLSPGSAPFLHSPKAPSPFSEKGCG
jgi:hypothetical protein